MSYEYKVIPAPVRGLKAKGLKTADDRFANALQVAMNEQAADRWEYLRTDTLPSEQREGLMSKTTVYRNMLVFRRSKRANAITAYPSAPQVVASPPMAKASSAVDESRHDGATANTKANGGSGPATQ
jgi:hypothetical protein